MKKYVFYKITNHFILLNSDGDMVVTAQSSGNKNFIFEINDSFYRNDHKFLLRSELKEFIDFEFQGKIFYVQVFNGFVIVESIGLSSFAKYLGCKFFLEKNKVYGDTLSKFFREGQKDILLKRVAANEKASTKEILDFLKEQAFCCDYSLWSFDKTNQILILENATISYDVSQRFKEANCGISAFLESEHEFQKKPVDLALTNSELLYKRGLRSINRIKIDFEQHQITLVVSFYSKIENFHISDQLLKQFKSILKYKYYEIIDSESEKVAKVIRNLYPTPEKESINTYLRRACKNISDCFQYEACSIFLKDQEKEILRLRATVDCELKDTPRGIFYRLNKKSLTARVYNDQITILYYNGIAKADSNSHTYDEKTELEATNWIGMPLSSFSGEKFGVIRVKNKYKFENGKKVINLIKSIHVQNLAETVNYLAPIVDLYLAHDEAQKYATKQKEYTQVLMHEIRSPITALKHAPSLIKRYLAACELPQATSHSVLKKLQDIGVLAERMAHITQSHNLNDILKAKKIQRLSLLEDVIFPVENFTKPYIYEQFGMNLDLSHDQAKGIFVLADKILLGMAIHALIENAAKYSYGNNKNVLLRVKNIGYQVDISIINFGLPIRKDEEESIYQVGYRGSKAVEQNIHGTGIGLFLCKEVMREINGEIILIRDSKDKHRIEFKLSLIGV